MILSFESSSVVGKSRMGNNLSTLERFAREVLVAAGADHDDAKALAEILLWADRVGRTGQGVQRLPILCERLTKKLINSPARFVWSTNGGAAAHLDAAEGLGHLAARQAALRAIALARENGIGAVTVSNSNYFGSAGYFAWLIAQAGMLGIVASNSFPKVAAYGGLKAVLGTNPLAFAAPIGAAHPLLVDMATAAVAGSEIRRRAAASLPLDPGMAVDAAGRPLLDAAKFSEGVALPFGGAKGFGIMLLVETLTGVLSGGAIGSEVNSMYKDWSRAGRSCHFLLAINPAHFPAGDAVAERMQTLQRMVELSGPGVRFPGVVRWQYYEETERAGIAQQNLPVAELRELAATYDLGFAL